MSMMMNFMILKFMILMNAQSVGTTIAIAMFLALDEVGVQTLV